jgi:hypothetical protein
VFGLWNFNIFASIHYKWLTRVFVICRHKLFLFVYLFIIFFFWLKFFCSYYPSSTGIKFLIIAFSSLLQKKKKKVALS